VRTFVDFGRRAAGERISINLGARSVQAPLFRWRLSQVWPVLDVTSWVEATRCAHPAAPLRISWVSRSANFASQSGVVAACKLTKAIAWTLLDKARSPVLCAIA